MATSGPRCGRIDYTNDLPVYAAFDEGALSFPGSVRAGVPAELNRALLAGDLDCSPISSFFYAQHADELVLLPGVCIGSRGAVRSIVCVSATPPQRLSDAPIAVTKESATGRALFEAICRSRFGFAPSLVEADDPYASYLEGGACIVIGDKAIDAALAAPAAHVHDLGVLWHEQFQTPMVYAVWASRREFAAREPHALRAVGDALAGALAWGFAHPDRVLDRAQRAHPRPEGFYAEYYRGLLFAFDAEAQAGLSRFFSVAAACGMLAAAPDLTFVDGALERV